jgi:protocatechuate 3,4-dioxygenase beta subunit
MALGYSEDMRRNKLFYISLLLLISMGVAYRFYNAKGRLSDVQSTASGAANNHSNGGPVRFRSLTSVALVGTVVDQQGRPLEGAQVILIGSDLEPRVTGADGSFEFASLKTGVYSLGATTEAGIAGPVMVRVEQVTAPVRLTIAGQQPFRVRIESLHGGDPVPSADVRLTGTLQRFAQTDELGLATFPGLLPGRYELVAEAAGHASTSVPVQIGPRPETVTIKLQPGLRLEGAVADEQGRPIAGAMVTALDRIGLGHSPQGHRSTATDVGGRFVFSGLLEGQYRVLARHAQHAPAQTEAIRLRHGTVAPGLRIVLSSGARVSGTVVGSDGRGVDRAEIRAAYHVPGQGGLGQLFQAHSGPDGQFTLQGLPSAVLTLLAVHESGTSADERVDLDRRTEVREIRLVLEHVQEIAGMVFDDSGQVVPRAEVWAVPASALAEPPLARRLRGRAAAITDEQGRFTLTGLTQGDHEVRCRWAAGSLTELDKQRRPVVARTGRRDLRLSLARAGGIAGQVLVDGHPPRSDFVVLLDGRPLPQASTRGGHFSLEDLPEGAYELHIEVDGFSSRRLRAVAVKPAAITDLDVIRFESRVVLRGRVLDARGAMVAGALVRAGSSIGRVDTLVREGGSHTGSAFSGSDGSFAIGLPSDGSATLAAEHPRHGRSALHTARPGQSNDLVLELAGGIRGSVRLDGGQPPAVRTGVRAWLRNSPQNGTIEVAEEDGQFEFSNLPAGEYLVSAQRLDARAAGAAVRPVVVKVPGGQTVEVDLRLPQGDGATIELRPGGSAGLCYARLVAARIVATNVGELEAAIAGAGAVFSAQSMASPAMPGRFTGLDAGIYTACLAPYPPDLKDPADIVAHVQTHGSELATVCQTVTLAESDRSLSIEIAATPPAPLPPQPSPGTN